MSKVHFHTTTTLSPEQFVAGLTDFGPDREKVFSKSADDYLEVHDLGSAEADVTEGSGGVWERVHYDWSDKDHVRLTTTDDQMIPTRLSHLMAGLIPDARIHVYRIPRTPSCSSTRRWSPPTCTPSWCDFAPDEPPSWP